MTKSLVTVTTPPYWWSKIVNKPSRLFTVKMVFCMIVGCGSESAPSKDLHFARVPSVVTNQGEAEKLSFELRSHWISAISRSDLTEKILANDVYTATISSQEEQRKVGTNTTLTGCRL